MTFKEYFTSLSAGQQRQVRDVISPGYFGHLMSGLKMTGNKTYKKLKAIDPNITWETLRD